MRRKLIPNIILILILTQSFVVNGQFTPAEVAKRQELEKFLKTAEITGHRDIGQGVTKPTQLFLKKGDVEGSGAWKNPKGKQKGYLEGWQYEIAAYQIDKLLDLNMIPPTVERKFNGKRGSLQFWVESQFSDLTMRQQGLKIPKSELAQWNKMKYIIRAFDSLIGNEDRTQQNLFYTNDWRTILIDHSRSFRSSKRFTQQLMYGKNGIKGEKLIRQLPRAFVEKIKALNFDDIKKAVGPYLKKKEIKAILIRKELLLKEIEEMIKEKGEDKVLY